MAGKVAPATVPSSVLDGPHGIDPAGGDQSVEHARFSSPVCMATPVAPESTATGGLPSGSMASNWRGGGGGDVARAAAGLVGADVGEPGIGLGGRAPRRARAPPAR